MARHSKASRGAARPGTAREDSIMINPISQSTRNHVWHELRGAMRLTRYYEGLYSHYQRRQSWLTGTLVSVSSLGILSGIVGLPIGFILAANAIVISILTWGYAKDYAKKAAIAHVVSHECAVVEFKWHRLWSEVDGYQIDEETAKLQSQELSERILEVTGWAGHASITYDKSINDKSSKDANHLIGQLYPSPERKDG